jgi:endonuclease YncB( thermonuclease family)
VLQRCVFKVDYTIDAAGGREFGSVVINERENVAVTVVAAGWAKVRPVGGQQSPYYEDLVKAGGAAEARGAGVHAKQVAPDAVRDLLAEGELLRFLVGFGAHSLKEAPSVHLIFLLLSFCRLSF